MVNNNNGKPTQQPKPSTTQNPSQNQPQKPQQRPIRVIKEDKVPPKK